MRRHSHEHSELIAMSEPSGLWLVHREDEEPSMVREVVVVSRHGVGVARPWRRGAEVAHKHHYKKSSIL